MATLEQALQDARNWWNPELKEAQIRKSIIDRVLRALDWPEAPGLTNVEESVESGSVDYALYAHGKSRQKCPSLYIEAKRPGKDTDGVVQAVDYAHENGGVPLVMVTDGKHWHFYLTHEPGSKKDNYAKRRALTLKLDDEHIAELLPTVLGRDAVADGTAIDELEKLHGYEMAKDEFRPAWSRLCESQDFAESVTKLLTAELERSGTEPSHDDALAFVKEKLGRVTPSPDNGGGREPVSPGKVEVTLTLDGEKIARCIGRGNAIKELVERARRTDSDFLSKLAEKGTFARKEQPLTNGERDTHWGAKPIGGYWVKTGIGPDDLDRFINDHYNVITGEIVSHTERKLP